MIEYWAPVWNKVDALKWLDAGKPITRKEDGVSVPAGAFPEGHRLILVNERFTPYVVQRMKKGSHAGCWRHVEVRGGFIRERRASYQGKFYASREVQVEDTLSAEALLKELDGEPERP